MLLSPVNAVLPLLLLVCCPLAAAYLRPAENPAALRRATQELRVEYDSADGREAAAPPALRLLPPGKTLAVSGRWDDRNIGNLQMGQVMKRHGWKCTFYLWDIPAGPLPAWMMNYDRKLLADGHGIGAHGSRHLRPSELAPDDAFRELAFNRARLEGNADRPVNTHAYAYGAFADRKKPQAARDIHEILFRSGLIHNVYESSIKSWYGLRPTDRGTGLQFIPGDRGTKRENFTAEIEKALANTAYLNTNPCIFIGVHGWMRDGDWAELEAGLAAYANRPEWWYCTQNEYAARFYEFHHTRLRAMSASGNQAVYRVERFLPAELGDAQTLTLAVPGARRVLLDGRELALLGPGAAGGTVELPPAGALPTRIETVEQLHSATVPVELRKFPSLRALARFDKTAGILCLKIVDPERRFAAERLTLRLPPAWPTPGTVQCDEPPRRDGEALEWSLRLPAPTVPPADDAPFWLELDFRYDNALPGRLHLLLDRATSTK